MVVRNHEGGTGLDAWQRRAEGSFGSWEWTRGRYVGWRAHWLGVNPMRGGVVERRRQLTRERSEEDDKVTRAVTCSFGCGWWSGRESLEGPAGNGKRPWRAR
jgi:hypothetical protein